MDAGLPSYGPPKGHVFFELSTASVEPSEAYDYWRDIAYYHWDAHRPPPDRVKRFAARTSAFVTPKGDLFVYRSSAVSGRRTARQIRKDEGDELNLGMVLAGGRRHRDEKGGVTVAGPGDFFCYDAAKPSQVEWDDHAGLHFTLPRSIVHPAVGDVPPASRLMEAFEASPLAPFLRAHLSVLAREVDSLPAAERAIVFDHTFDLLLTVLRQAVGSTGNGEAEPDSFYALATRVIREHMSDPTLDANKISRILQVSKSTLYRAFARQGLTVAGSIRELRLREAKRRLIVSPPEASVSEIAAECGFVDARHFRRIFRERFDMNPTDVREFSEIARDDLLIRHNLPWNSDLQ